jgi:glycosyltransferase involved in cell wall biosynthesis
MVNAFQAILAPDWTLEIYGDGSALGEIREIAKTDLRINVHGSVANDIVIQAQHKASILINPRKNNQEFTCYSFPSKIIEYMSSGTPVLAYKLDGMPDEYLPYFYQIAESQDGLTEALQKVIRLPEEHLRKMGANALSFIEEQKNAKVQCERIISMFKDDINGTKEKNPVC